MTPTATGVVSPVATETGPTIKVGAPNFVEQEQTHHDGQTAAVDSVSFTQQSCHDGEVHPERMTALDAFSQVKYNAGLNTN